MSYKKESAASRASKRAGYAAGGVVEPERRNPRALGDMDIPVRSDPPQGLTTDDGFDRENDAYFNAKQIRSENSRVRRYRSGGRVKS